MILSCKRICVLFTILLASSISAQNSTKCTYTINSWSWKFDGEDVGNLPNVTIHDSIVAANHPLSTIGNNPKLTLKGGDVICMDASVSYRFLRFENITGNSGNPVIITNVGGQVAIKNITTSYGWMFKKSKNFKILGNGDPNYKYGFKVTTHKNSYLQMIDKTTDFEIAHVEIAGDTIANNASSEGNLLGFAGIMAKSQPICWDDENGGSTDAGNFEMKNVSMHDNYIHDVAGEGMYVGYGKSQGVFLNSSSTGNQCSRENFPHNISNLFIYNNIVENVGWDGIQVKNAHHNAHIYNNVIKNYATLGVGPHDEGLFVGDGSEALIYGNWIENGNTQSNGMQINAFGDTKIYNNVVLGSGYVGLYLNNNSPQFANRAGTFEIYNNTIEGGTSPFAILAYTPQNVIVKNNIAFGYNYDPNRPYEDGIKKISNIVISSNIIEKNTSNVGFKEYSNQDIRLVSGALAVDTGESNLFNTTDFTGSLRTDGKIDIGAIEKDTNINNLDINIAITAPSTNNVTVVSGQDLVIKGALIDINNKVKAVQFILNNNVVSTVSLPNKIEHTVGYQNLILGSNTFNFKVILYGGVTFSTASITINNPEVLKVDNHRIDNQLKINYNNLNNYLVINKLKGIDIKEVYLYNLLGKKIQSWKKINRKKNIVLLKVKNRLSGIYIIKAKTDKGILTKKILFI